MALERPGSLRGVARRPYRRLTGRLTTLIALGLVVFAIVLPGATLISLELDRRSFVVERVFREAQLQLLTEELSTLIVSPTPSPAPSPTPSPTPAP